MDSMTKNHRADNAKASAKRKRTPLPLFGTDSEIKKLPTPKNGRTQYRDKLVPGLYLFVSSNGSRVFYGMVKEKRRMSTTKRKLGHYLTLSLRDARDIVERARDRAKAGLDPWVEVDSSSGRSEDTFKAVRERFLRQYVSQLAPNTQKGYESALESDRLKRWEAMSIRDINKSDVIALIDEIFVVAPVQANRTFAYLRKFFNWCAEKDVIKENERSPMYLLKPPLKKETARHRVLGQDKKNREKYDTTELREFWKACDSLGYPFGTCFQLMLLTGQRKTEVATLEWVDIHEGVWAQSKNKADRQHLVPLSRQARDLLEAIPRSNRNSELVFSTNGETPISGFGKAKRRLDGLLSMQDWVIHDLRRTAATHMRRNGISLYVTERILNHAEKGVTAEVYDHYDLLPEKAEALQIWGDYLERVVGSPEDNVIDLRAKQN
ncbi:MAG: tyrosine-type recombinase/integrase [Pseudomonadota bacterium]